MSDKIVYTEDDYLVDVIKHSVAWRYVIINGNPIPRRNTLEEERARLQSQHDLKQYLQRRLKK